jgi:hypothetical protein
LLLASIQTTKTINFYVNSSIWREEFKLGVFFFLPWKCLKKQIWAQEDFLFQVLRCFFVYFFRLLIDLTKFLGCFLDVLGQNGLKMFFFIKNTNHVFSATTVTGILDSRWHIVYFFKKNWGRRHVVYPINLKK